MIHLFLILKISPPSINWNRSKLVCYQTHFLVGIFITLAKEALAVDSFWFVLRWQAGEQSERHRGKEALKVGISKRLNIRKEDK